MPISLLTGLPGNGKTLRLLHRVRALQKQSKRAVYYFDIRLKDHPEVADWIPLGDPATFGRRKEKIEPDLTGIHNWQSIVPSGSILVVDECWAVFPKRGPSAMVPKFVEHLATHRHAGIDVFLTSQHAVNQVDHFVRGLVQEHEHVVRLAGTDTARVHRWDQGLGDPTDYHSRQASVTEIWRFPKEVYEWYQSAELHTVKVKLPWTKIGMAVGALTAVGFGLYSTWDMFSNMGVAEEVAADASSSSSSGPLQSQSSKRGAKSPYDASEFVPTVAAVPFTAPFYRDAVAVSAAPRVAGCMQLTWGKEILCKCTSQQGTVIDMDLCTCMHYVKSGAFQFDRDDDYYPKYEAYVPPLAPPMSYGGGEAPAQPPEGAGGASS